MATYRNYLKRANSTPILGAQACLYNTSGERLDVDITEAGGLYQFFNVATGHYQVRFFGRDLSEDDWLEIDVIDEIEIEANLPIIFVTTPSLVVIEGETKITKQGEISDALFTLNDVTLTQGKIASIDLFYKSPSENETQWRLLEAVSVTTDDNIVAPFSDSNTITGISQIELFDLSVTNNFSIIYDFKANFYNADSEIAVDTNSTVVAPTDLTYFYGIHDLQDIIGVTNLDTTNTKQLPENIYLTIPGDEVAIKWDDMRKVSPAQTFYAANGSLKFLSKVILRSIKEYAVYIYLSTYGVPPENPWPIPRSDSNGEWYFLTKIPTNRAYIRVPRNKFFKIWVGFSSETTLNSIIELDKQQKF